MPTSLKIRTFGMIAIHRGAVALDDRLPQRARALLVYLATTGREVPRPVVADLLWDQGSSQVLLSRLRTLLTNLRQELKPYLCTTRDTVALNPEASLWLDAAELELGLAVGWRGQAPADRPDPGSLAALGRHLDLYRGEFLHGFHLSGGHGFEVWQLLERERWRLQVLEAYRELVATALALSQYHFGLRQALRWIELDPLNEIAYRQTMELYARSGQRAAALRQYQLCKQRLDEEAGLLLTTETIALAEAIKANRLVSVTTPIGTKTTVPEARTAVFVGRKRQLETLAAVLQIARSEDRQIRFVTGGAGRGKSMLVHEFGRQAQLADPALLVACGHGHDQTGHGAPYLPWREALAMLSGENETCQAACQISDWQVQRLRAAMLVTIPALVAQAPALIDSLIPAEALQQRAAAIAPADGGWFKRLQTLVTAKNGLSLHQKDIFTQVAAWLKTVAASRPLVIILEDLHWADPVSCGLLFYLSRHLVDSPILLLGTYRTEELVRQAGRERHPLVRVVDELKRQHGDIWLDLGRLGEVEDRLFVTDYLDSRPNRLAEPFREKLFRHTGGHPLFTVELVQAMQARGELRQDKEGFWTAAGTIDWQSLPAQVEGVIEARLHRLPEALLNTLCIASVEGERFTAEVVARVQDRTDLAVIRQLSQELDRQRLVSARKPEQPLPGGRQLSPYHFRHHLFQQYLYQHLDEPERIILHEAVGTALEELHGGQAERVASRLAHHFQKAGIADKAAGYLLIAGKQAMWLGAYTEAAAHLTTGLELLETMPDSPERARQELVLHLTLGHALIPLQGYAAPAVKDCFDRARILCSQVDAPAQLLPVSYALILYYLMRGELAVAQQLGQQFLQQAGRHADSTALLVGHRALGAILLYSGQLPAARQHLEESISRDDPAQHPTVAAQYFQTSSATGLIEYAFTLCLLGYPDQTRRQVEAALRLAETETYPVTKGMILSFAAVIHSYLREFAKAQQYAEAAKALAGQYEIIFWEAVGRIIMSAARVQQGAAGLEAVTDMDQARARYQTTGARLGLPYVLSLLAETLARLDQPALAQARLAEALASGEETGHRLFESELYRLQGELLARQGAPAGEVETCFERAIARARQQQVRWFELRATVSLCRWQAQGKQAEATKMLAEITNWFTEGFDTPDLVEARQLLESLGVPRPETAAVEP